MKTIYVKPEATIVSIQQNECILTSSDISKGNAYKSGDEVLSRRGGSVWDDEDEEED